MERQSLFEQVSSLRREGKSIRAIAAQLKVHPSRVQRAIRSLEQRITPSEQHSVRFQPRDGDFVGRQRELGILTAALDDTLSGRGRVVMLVGEPGIGKTRTAQELSSYAVQHGAQVWWGRCYEEPGMPPYWPWVQVIRAYLRGHEGSQLRSQMGAGAADIAEVVPEVRERLPDLPSPPFLEPQQARFRLFDSVAAFLMRASQTQPLMLVLDNLHWADRSSLLLLEFLAQEMTDYRLLVLGTCRDAGLSGQHPLSSTIGEVARHPYFSRVSLPGFSQAEVNSFIQARASIAPHPDLVQAVHAQTEGNPLFVTQVVQLLAQQGQLASATAMTGRTRELQIPPGVQEVIGRRLEHLSERCNQVLTVASVIGREFGLGLLEWLMADPSTSPLRISGHDLSSNEVLEGVEEALAARVLEEMPHTEDRYQFTHVLIQNTLAQQLSAARRARLHAQIGQALEELYGVNAEAHAAELAYHFSQAATVLGPEKLVHYSLVAGEQALATYAHEEAVGQLECGLAAKGVPLIGTMPAGDDEEAALLFALGRAQLAVLEPREYQKALTNLTRAFDHYAKTGDVGRAVAIAQCPVQSSPLTGRHTGVIELVGRAVALVPPDSHEAGQLLCQYGNTLYYETGNYDGALKALNQAISIAQQGEDAALEMRALVAAGHAEAAHLHFQESLRFDLRALALASTVDEPFEETHALQEVAAVLHRTGDLEGARRYAAAMLPVAERLRHRTRLWQALQANTVVSSLEGEWESALSLSDRALVLSPRNPNLLGYRALIEYAVGNFVQGRTYLERLLEAMQRTAPGPTFEYAYPAIVVPLVTHLRDLDSRLEVAEEAAYAVLSSPWVTPVLASLARAGLALLAVRREDEAAAEEQYSALHPRRETMLGGLLDSIISADRLLGLLAYTMGKPAIAATHFEDALAFCRKAGYRPELAWSCYDYAATLVQAGLKPTSTDAHLKAISLMDETLAISTELGMKPLMEKTSALREGIGPQPVGVSKYPANLTQRQVQVLRLMAAGKTDREIEQELSISVRTVQRHVADIYVKIGARNRSEATAFALSKLHPFE
jgi:DNA-binding CsgD family transcriptional regulator/tetratricopeptide (TPR) repeat protein